MFLSDYVGINFKGKLEKNHLLWFRDFPVGFNDASLSIGCHTRGVIW